MTVHFNAWTPELPPFDGENGSTRTETVTERWGRAELFFDAKDYTEAARLLATIVERVPEQVAPGCCWPAPTTTRRNCGAPRSSCAR